MSESKVLLWFRGFYNINAEEMNYKLIGNPYTTD